jgi:hypothetical protein
LGILQLIHHISNALELSPGVDEFQDDTFFECMGEGRSGDSTDIYQKAEIFIRIAAFSFPLFSLKPLSSRANPPLSVTDI